MNKQTGGPAFPHQNNLMLTNGGMTLRDYFAGQALHGWLSSWDRKHKVHEDSLALFCYDVADAMLAVREEEEE